MRVDPGGPATGAIEDIFARATFFDALPHEARGRLASRAVREEYPAGSVILWEGDEGDCFYVVASGELEVWASVGPAAASRPETNAATTWEPDPRSQRLVNRLVPGDGFGEMALLLGGRRRATVRAVTDAVLYGLDAQTFLGVVREHRGLAASLEEVMTLRATSNAMGRASPFAGLPPEALEWLAVRAEECHFEAGQVIVRQGDPGDAFYIVTSGRASVGAVGRAGSERQLSTLGPGDCFGEQALLTSEPRSATVRAEEPVEALRLSRNDFETVLEQHKDRHHYFVQLVVQRQRPSRIAPWHIERVAGNEGAADYVLKNPRTGKYIRLSEQGRFVWELMDGDRTISELTVAYFIKYRIFGYEPIVKLMLQLRSAGFLMIQRFPWLEGSSEGKNPLRALMSYLSPWLVRFFSLPDVDPLVTWFYRYLLRPLYVIPVQLLLFVATLAGAGLFAYLVVSGAMKAPLTLSMAVAARSLLLGFVIHVAVHELAHACTCKHFGKEVHRAGAGWYFFMPSLFVDTSDIWAANKFRRAAVSFAGPYSNFVLSGAATLVIPLVADPSLQLTLFNFALVGYIGGVMNLNPLMEFDGYYVLMDLLDLPNLRVKSMGFLGTVLWHGDQCRYPVRVKRIFVGFGVLSVAYTLFIALMVLTGYHSYVEALVAGVLPSLAAATIGWALAILMGWLILSSAWRDLRAGAGSSAETAVATG